MLQSMRDEIERARADIERAHSGEASSEGEASKAQKLADLRKRYMELSDAALLSAAADSERRKSGLKRARGETTASGLDNDEEARSADEYEEDEEDEAGAQSGDELDFTERRRRETAARGGEEDAARAQYTAPLDALRPREGAATEFEEGGDEDAFQEAATGAGLQEAHTATAAGDDEAAFQEAPTVTAFEEAATLAATVDNEEVVFREAAAAAAPQGAAAAAQPSDATQAEFLGGGPYSAPATHEDAEVGTIAASRAADSITVDHGIVEDGAQGGEEAAETAEWNDRDSVAGDD
jgi:hypothetical protein